MASINIKDLVKSYNDRRALDCLNMEIRSGEIMGLLGPNGAGKTTLLSILSAVFTQDSGTVDIVEKKGFSGTPADFKQNTGIVPQDISLYGDFNSIENIVFFSRMYGKGGKSLRDKTSELLSLAGLEKRSRERIKNLSGGMKRRLNFVCGLVNSPSLVLLDEPTVGVDPQSREHIYSMVRRLRDEGVTVILATHYMFEAETLCDRIAVMDRGKVLMVHTADEYMSLFGEKLGLEGINMEKIFLHITGKELRD